MLEEIEKDIKKIIIEFIEKSGAEKNDLLVIGCSSSEVIGGNIGKNSNYDVAKVIYETITPILKEKGINLACQCCEHLNRALVIEKSIAKEKCYEIVKAIPQIHAGGSFATVAYEQMEEPVLVEEIKADLGIDIGGTLIGMHLKKVAVPLKLSTNKLYKANIICAYTRPKFIGGSRTIYEL
jgi:uncharacterized protein (TIGR01440 family)